VTSTGELAGPSPERFLANAVIVLTPLNQGQLRPEVMIAIQDQGTGGLYAVKLKGHFGLIIRGTGDCQIRLIRDISISRRSDDWGGRKRKTNGKCD
jgi:hypothetical protein